MKLNGNVTPILVGAGLTIGAILLMNLIGKTKPAAVLSSSRAHAYPATGRMGSPRVKYISDRAMRIPMNSFVGRSAYQAQEDLEPWNRGLPNTYQSVSGDYNSINVFDLA